MARVISGRQPIRVKPHPWFMMPHSCSLGIKQLAWTIMAANSFTAVVSKVNIWYAAGARVAKPIGFSQGALRRVPG
eukprot:12579553-Prorocentrum_lima.AAC.1